MDRSSVLTLARGEAGSRGGGGADRSPGGCGVLCMQGLCNCPPPPPGKAPPPRWPPPSPSSSSPQLGRRRPFKEEPSAGTGRSGAGTPGQAAAGEGLGAREGKQGMSVSNRGKSRPVRGFLKLPVTRERWGSELSPPAQGGDKFPGGSPSAPGPAGRKEAAGHPLWLVAQLAQRLSCPPNFTAFLLFIHAHIRVEVWAAAMREAGGVPRARWCRTATARSGARPPSAPSAWVPCR